MRLPPPRATVALVAVTAAAWGIAAVSGLGDEIALRAGFIPARWSGLALDGAVPALATPLTATLVHANLLHLGFNLLMLGFCGRFVEVSLRVRGIAILFLVGAYAAAAAEWAVHPGSTAPVIGASGAISAIVAAYALLYGERRTVIRIRWLADLVHVLWLAAAWIGLQLLFGLVTLGDGHPIAVAAHIGGFLAGLILARPLLRWGFHQRVALGA